MSAGRRIGDFVLVGPLGAGGQGQVYRALQDGLEREAAVKLVDVRRGADRFLREARLASRLDHPYAAHVYAHGVEADGTGWIAMELVRGTPLDELLRAGGAIAAERFVPFFERLCEVVQTAHDAGIVHGDLKPANVMVVGRAGRLLPKLLDLGVARAAGDDAALAGTAAYLAPERWRGGAAGTAADRYALGVLAWEALAGRPPFSAANAAGYAEAHLGGAPQGDLAPGLAATLGRALAKDPAERFASALELGAALRAAAGLDSAPDELPRLDETLRDLWISGAPQPLAELTAALEAARSAHQVRGALRALVRTTVRWLALVALAARAGPGPEPRDAWRGLLDELRVRALDDAEWLALLGAACRPYRELRDLHPIPELVELFAEPKLGGELAALLGELGRDDAEPEERVRARLAAAAPEAARLLGRLEVVLDYPLGIARGGRALRLTGVRRTVPAGLRIAGVTPPEGSVFLASPEGRVVLELSPLVQLAAPLPGAPEEIYLLEGGSPRGARLVAPPLGDERIDEAPWAWLASRLGAGSAPEVAADAAPERSPYPGLAPFTAGDADRFVGREREALALLSRLRRQTWVAVVGPSGAGKSSFVNAGVVPALEGGWQALTMRPGARPTETLRLRLAARAAGAAGCLIVVDQLEELFTLGSSPDEQRAFVDALAELTPSLDASCRVVLTLRDDFLMRAEPLLGTKLAQLCLLGTPSAEDLERILVEPARRAGVRFEDPGLPAEMVRTVGTQPGALPLLSFTMARLWELRDRPFGVLPRRAYDALGGVAGALAAHAEATLAGLPAVDRRLARALFRRLITADGTRAVLSEAELLAAVGGGARAAGVVAALVEARLLVAGEGEGEGGERQIELIHEALIERWPRLRAWILEDAETARLRDQLRSAAQQWEQRGRPGGLLWRGEALLDVQRYRARDTAALAPLEEAFAAASLAEAARGRRVRRWLLAGAITVLAGSTAGLAILAGQANRERARAVVGERGARAGLASLYAEQGRQLELAGQPRAALVYLLEAQATGADRPGVRQLAASAARSLRAELGAYGGHQGKVWSVEISPDGTRLASGGEDGRALLRVLPGGAVLAVLAGHEDDVWQVGFSADGSRLVTVSWDGSARLWDGRTGAAAAILSPGIGRLTHAAFAAAGDRIALAGEGGVRVFDVAGRELAALPHPAIVWDVAFSPDGALLATGAEDGRVRVWNGTAARVLAGHAGVVRHVAFSPDGARLLSASWDGTARIWNLADGSATVLRGHNDRVDGGRFLPGGARVLTAGRDGIARLWDARTGASVAQLSGHHGYVAATAVSPDGAHVATAGGDGGVRMWDSRDGAPLAVFSGHAGPATAVTFAPDCATLFSGGWDGNVRLWSTAAQNPVRSVHVDAARLVLAARGDAVVAFAAGGAAELRIGDAPPRPLGAIRAASFSGDGRRLVTVTSDGARVSDVAGGAEIATVPASGAALDLDGSRVAAGSGETIRVTWLDGGHPPLVLEDPHSRVTLRFLPGDRLAAGGLDKTIRVWSLAAPGAPLVLEGHSGAVAALASAGNDRLVSCSEDRTARVWDLRDGRLLGTLAGHVGPVLSVAATADFIATGSDDRSVRLWDGATFQLLAVYEGHTGAVDQLRLDQAAGTLTSAGWDGALKTWDVATRPVDPVALRLLARCRYPAHIAAGQLVPDLPDPAACAAMR